MVNCILEAYQFGASVFDTDSKTITHTAPRLDQPEGIGFLNGKVYFGTYGSARIYAYNPKRPSNTTMEPMEILDLIMTLGMIRTDPLC